MNFMCTFVCTKEHVISEMTENGATATLFVMISFSSLPYTAGIRDGKASRSAAILVLI